ncbi:hypothetical protein [Pseudomonas chlororaphis]|uniref:hypothetical protein n=1 Tax=Pseudomonas chlororaphis TaxID=587753 RepID=UPI0011CD8D63|nr:hypothetical protein [Pseudomonas chlororaphis]
MFGFFRKKVKGLAENNGEKMAMVPAENIENLVHERPLVCTFDIDPEVSEILLKGRFNCTSGSLGTLMSVPNTQRDTQHLLQPNNSVPENFHEFDIAVIDMGSKAPLPYERTQHLNFKNVTGNKIYAFLSEYPQHIFDFKPFGANWIASRIDSFLKKDSILIVFADEGRSADYKLVEISAGGNQICDRMKHSNMDFYSSRPSFTNKIGSRIRKTEKNLNISELILKYMRDGEYKVVFDHPTSWSGSERKYLPVGSFTPLALNDIGEIVSYAQDVESGLVLVFPQIKNKGEFLCELFNSHLAEHFPTIFPFSGQFGWLDDGSYPLPGESELLESRVRLEEQYLKDIQENEASIAKLKNEYKFLRELLYESGEKLVSAIAIYFSWLGFGSVVNMDEIENDILEEDLQIDCGDKLLVVEIKGIGGTSTDKACSQISKIKFRRAEQRGKFDVYGLYIVNHQRYVAPKNRRNPPFTEHQVNDARLDKRGLLTTYSLYQAYFLIAGGIVTKEFVRNRLFDFGVVDFYPSNMISIGQPNESLKKNKILIFELKNTNLSVGMKLVAKKGDSYSVHTIQSLQVSGVNVNNFEDGEVGIMLDVAVPNRSEILLWDEAEPAIQG